MEVIEFMQNNNLEKTELKEVLKEAIIELIYEKREELMEIFWEALEDYSLGKAIEEGLSTKNVSKEEILKVLES